MKFTPGAHSCPFEDCDRAFAKRGNLLNHLRSAHRKTQAEAEVLAPANNDEERVMEMALAAGGMTSKQLGKHMSAPAAAPHGGKKESKETGAMDVDGDSAYETENDERVHDREDSASPVRIGKSTFVSIGCRRCMQLAVTHQMLLECLTD